MSKFIRKIMLWSHRWLGIIVGLHFVLLGLSGSYLIYSDEIESVFRKDVKVASAAPQNIELEKAIRNAQAGLGVQVTPMSIGVASKETNYNHELMFNIPQEEQKRRFVTAYIDATTQEFKGASVYKETLTGFLFVFHHDLFSGPTGRTFVAVTGVLSLILLLGGLYLWWPKGDKTWKRVLRYNQQRTFLGTNLELHKVVGFYSLILMIIVTFSGIYLARSDWFFPRKAEVQGSFVAKSSETAAPDFGKLQISLNPLLETNEIAQIRVDAKTGNILGLARQKDLGISGWEWDGQTGDLLATKYLKDRTFEKQFGDLQRDWHFGHFWGELGRFLIFLSGILPLFFYVTGFYVWFKKRSIKVR
ncbi:PepSY-associated TM helix domain-containing protein [Bdellovibrio sp. HCB-162]|uniref:PepSY-associated TM helix domain-containing protein n=1 Tax=Bdellovibrio sp. HCB-162 TaxID=3394234 RepID=UPI0039BD47D4